MRDLQLLPTKSQTLSIFLPIICLLLFDNCKKEHAKSSLKDIKTFVFQMAANPSLKADIAATINQTTDTINIGLPQGTNLTSLTPTITYDGVSISPGSNTPANFSTSLQYTVTAQDGSTKSYTVVASLLSSAKAITSFAFLVANNAQLSSNVSGIIANDTIRVYIAPGTNLTNLAPTITYTGTQVNPGNNIAQNFSNPVRYIVTAQDGSAVNYTVIVGYNVTVYLGSTDDYLYALDAGTGALLWKAATNGPINSSPTVAGSKVYVGSDDGYLYAFDAATGALRWKAMTQGPVEGNPTVSGGMVYVDNNSSGEYTTSNLTAFDTAAGNQQWIYNLPVSPTAQSPTVVNGILYQTSPYGSPGLAAFDPLTGVSLWQDLYSPGFRGNPAIVNGAIYAGAVYYALTAVDVQTHAVKWLYLERAVDSSPIVDGSIGSPTVDGANVFIPVYSNDIYALDTSGALKWKFSTSSGVQVTNQFTSAVTGNGLLFAGNANSAVYAMDENTGSVEWIYGTPVGGGVASGEPTYANGTVYCGCTPGNFCALDATTGAVKWTFTAGGIIAHGPCVTDANGNAAHPATSGDHQ
jgi:outer membrane protein assembly factor BamB